MPVFCIFQGFGNQADSDNVAEIFTYGKAFKTGELHTHPWIVEEVKRIASHYQFAFIIRHYLWFFFLVAYIRKYYALPFVLLYFYWIFLTSPVILFDLHNDETYREQKVLQFYTWRCLSSEMSSGSSGGGSQRSLSWRVELGLKVSCSFYISGCSFHILIK